MMQIEVLYTGPTGSTLCTRCQGWDEDEALRRLKLTLDDLLLDGARLQAVMRVNEPQGKPFLVN